MFKNILSNLVRFAHFLLIIILIFGIFLPSKYLIYYLILLPGMYIHWHFNDNKCMLTELESVFDDKYTYLNNHEEMRYYKYLYVFDLLKKIKIYPGNYDFFTSYLYNIFFICWIVGLIRLLNYYKKSIFRIWSTIKKPLQRRWVNDIYT